MTTLVEDQLRASNQGKPGFDALGNPIVPTVSSVGPDQVRANKAVAKSMGIDIPGVNETPTTISGDKSSTISNNTQAVNDISNKVRGTVTGADTFERYSNGDWQNAPASAVANVDENGRTVWQAGGKSYYLAPDTAEYQSPVDKQSMELIDQIKSQTDAAFAGQISAVKAQFESLIKQQQDSNTRQGASVDATLLAGGTSRYAGLNAAGLSAAQVNYGLQKISDLQNQENSAVTSLIAAQASKDYEIVGKKLDLIKEINAKKQKEVNDLNDKLTTANKEIRQQTETRNNAIDNDIRSAILEAQKGGATPDQVKKMQSALASHDYAAAIDAGGDSLANASGIIGEYNFYKKQAQVAGQTPVDFQEYQNIDANRKIKIAAAGVAGASGYNPATLTKITQKAGQFDNEPSVRAYQVVAEGKSYLDSIPSNTQNPADQIGILYAFAKIMDPNSVVREGEYNTVQKYAQSWADSFGFKAERIFSNTPFLSEEAVKNMKATISSKVSASEKSYKNIYDEYGRIINKISGGTDGLDFLTDYSKGYGQTGTDLVQSEDQAKQKVLDYGKTNTEYQDQIRQMVQDGVPYAKIIQVINIQ